MPGSPRFVKHRRQILIVTYLAYFAFTIYEVDFNLQKSSNVYNDLGVPIDVTENALNSRFRRLTLKYHPDKVAQKDQARATDFYRHLSHAREIILDPAKRWAYDRFGPDGLRACAKCVTIKEYTDNALIVAMGTYGALFLFLIGTNALGFLRDGAYWRYLAILAIAVYDVRTAMRPDSPSFITKWLNPLVTGLNLRPAYLPFQVTSIVKKASISAAQFLGLLIPLYRDDPQRPAKATDDSDESRHKQLDRLEAVVQAGNQDVTRILELESTIFKENERAKGELRSAMTNYMVQNVIHQEPEVRNAIGQRIGRRRTGAPHGAQGTK
jgi:curved DNA-binding protein CbpA